MSEDRKGIVGFSTLDILALGIIVSSVIINIILRIQRFDDTLDPEAWRLINYTLFSIIVISATWLVTRYLGRLFERMAAEPMGGEAKARSTWKLISYVIWIIVLGLLLTGSISDPSGMALVVGLIGAALAFVLQQPLLNLVGWIIISTRGLYKIGDRIAIAQSRGYVVDISTMQTDIREFGEWMVDDNFTGRIVSIPNSFIFQNVVSNYTKDSQLIWDEVRAVVSFDSDTEVAKEIMLASAREVIGEAMRETFHAYQSRMEFSDIKNQVFIEPQLKMKFAESGVEIAVFYFTSVQGRWMVRTRITEKVWTGFSKDHRVRLAVPHRYIQGRME